MSIKDVEQDYFCQVCSGFRIFKVDKKIISDNGRRWREFTLSHHEHYEVKFRKELK
ncbi:hypothetical protein RyT2_16320 [Pseudolactococcus yaeyamensis]